MMRGDQLTVAHLLEFLSARGHKVEFFTIRSGGQMSAEQESWLHDRCRNVMVYDHGPMAMLRGLLQGAFELAPVQVGLFNHPQQKKDVRRAITASKYDIVYTYYVRSGEIARGLGRIDWRGSKDTVCGNQVTFLAMQLSQTLNTRRIRDNASNVFERAFFAIEHALMRRYEARIWQDFTRTVLIGPRDLAEVQHVCREQGRPEICNYIFGAHGTDVSRFMPRPDIQEKPGHIVFSGGMAYPPNVQAAMWFAQHVWPAVKEAVPTATWSIVGRDPAPELDRIAGLADVAVTGTVPDVSTYVAEASVCINPMQAAGGMQNKLIEYLASGKPVVATSIANEGIMASDGDHLIIADEPADFARAVVSLLNDRTLRGQLGSAARRFTLEHWTWEAHFLKLEKAFYDAIADAAKEPENHDNKFLLEPAVDGRVSTFDRVCPELGRYSDDRFSCDS